MPIPNRNFFLATEPVQRVVRALSSGTVATSTLLLHGEDGIGKSSASYYALREGTQALVLHGAPSASRTPYHPIAEALYSIAERGGRSAVLRQTAVGIGTDLLRLIPVLGTFSEPLAQIYKDWGISEIAPVTQPYDIIFQVQKILTRLAAKYKVITLFEDIGLYDSASLGILEALLKNPTLPVSCVLTLDPLTLVDLSREERERFDRFDAQITRLGFRRIEFRSFSQDETRTFIDGYLRPNLLSNTQVETMHEITGGNPLFLKELITYLLDENIMRTDSGSFIVPRDYAFNAVPHSMSHLINMRVRRLQAELRDVIDVAAVLGPEFNPRPITGTLKLEHIVTLRRLKELEATHRLINETARAHVFTYRSIRDHIYALLGPALAREHHLLIAGYLEQHPSIDDNEYLIYTHLAQAGEVSKALPHLRNAAYDARSRSNFAAAAERFHTASQLVRHANGDDVTADELLFEAALSGANAGMFYQAVEWFSFLTEHARQSALRAAALLQLGLAQWIGDGPKEAMRNLNLLLERHAGELDERSEVEARLALASILYHLGEWESARSHYRKCFRTTAIRVDPVLRARARRCLNMFYECDSALPLLQEALRDLKSLRDLPLYWEIRHNIACNHMLVGELSEARTIFEEVLNWFDSAGTYRAIYSENNLGIISMVQGHYDDAECRFRRVAAMPVSPFERIAAECHLAVLRVLQGDFDGVQAIEALVPEVCARPESFTREMVFHNLGWAQMRAGRLEEAVRTLMRGLREQSSSTSDLETGRAHRLLRRLAESGLQIDEGILRSPEADLLERTGRRERWWYTAMEYQAIDLWCWE